MAIAKVNIVEAGSSVLRERAEDVPVRLMKSEELRGFVRIMLAAMKDASGSWRRSLVFPYGLSCSGIQTTTLDI